MSEYRIGYVSRYDSYLYGTYEEAEKAAKIKASGGSEYFIAKEVAHVLPDETSTVVIKV